MKMGPALRDLLCTLVLFCMVPPTDYNCLAIISGKIPYHKFRDSLYTSTYLPFFCFPHINISFSRASSTLFKDSYVSARTEQMHCEL